MTRGRTEKALFGVRPDYWISFALILAILGAYGPITNYPFINLDDSVYVYENPHIREGLSLKGIRWALTATYASNWHPLTWLSHMADVTLFGMNPGLHHLTNLYLHVINSLMLFLFLKRFTGSDWKSGMVAMLFALHPINVESVAWVSQRKTLLCALFWILTMWSYCRNAEHPGLGRYMIVLLCFVVGLLAKPAIVSLPIILLFLDRWPLERYAKHSDLFSGGSKALAWRLILEKIPLFLFAAFESIITFWAQKSGGAVTTLTVLPLDVRVSNAIVSYISYLKQMLFPINLVILYPHPRWIPGWQIAGSALLLALIAFLAVKDARRRPYVIVCWLWYGVALIPMIGIVQVGIQAIADRYAYIPLIGIFILMVWFLADISANWMHQKVKLASIAGILIVTLIGIARGQVETWRNSISLFDHALSATTGNYLAHYQLGMALAESGRIDEALSHYANAIEINPKFEFVHFNVGVAMFLKGRLDEAADAFSRALKIDPLNAAAYDNLGAVRFRQGDVNRAIRHFRKALSLDPRFANAHKNLASAFYEKRAFSEALYHYESALQIDPGDKYAHNNLGLVLIAQGRYQDAVNHFTKAFEIDSNFEQARHNLNLLLSKISELE
ncbi:MAG: tetratricopeptide repeat protein [Desulfobacteraceae bacterium]|nr:MAG: tetratricopeptide repeat protein [Desulfobacteraceae bacterium]